MFNQPRDFHTWAECMSSWHEMQLWGPLLLFCHGVRACWVSSLVPATVTVTPVVRKVEVSSCLFSLPMVVSAPCHAVMESKNGSKWSDIPWCHPRSERRFGWCGGSVLLGGKSTCGEFFVICCIIKWNLHYRLKSQWVQGPLQAILQVSLSSKSVWDCTDRWESTWSGKLL